MTLNRDQHSLQRKLAFALWCVIALLSFLFIPSVGESREVCESPAALPKAEFHLTARPWLPLAVPKERYLDILEGLCRYSRRQQNSEGAIIDPYLHREVQYSTPYYAYAVATLVGAGHAPDLLSSGIAAMDHATAQFGKGRDGIPDQHGEFFIASLTEALEKYKSLVNPQQYASWRSRMRLPVMQIIVNGLNNWQTYAMKGEWLRSQEGLIEKPETISFIEQAWNEQQRGRISTTFFGLYHDRSSDPDSLSVEVVGRGNLLALVEDGYDGPSASAIRYATESGTRVSLFLQDPSGQTPANGRTDDHVFVDIAYQLAFEVMAERMYKEGNAEMAGVYRHAAMLSLANIKRWRRTDPGWEGSYFITKNHFDPSLRVGYQLATQYSNYTGALMFHLAEAYNTRKSQVEEQPAPSEIGGYALQLDDEFATAFANAGGLQVQVNLRGQVSESSGNYWTPLGVVRFARGEWDTRLGPSDGALTANSGLTFGPAFVENGKWLRMAELSRRYEASFSASFVHPTLVRCAVEYRPKRGFEGPVFHEDLIITPDGVLSTTRKIPSGGIRWGITWPLLANDGAPLEVTISARFAETRFKGNTDRESFLAIGPHVNLNGSSTTVRSTYGDLQPVLQTTDAMSNQTFIYPNNNNQPSSLVVTKSFRLSEDGFISVLGRVSGNVYVGRTVAGGEGVSASIRSRGKPDVKFSNSCRFVLQLHHGRVIAAEVDRHVYANIQGTHVELEPYAPLALKYPKHGFCRADCISCVRRGNLAPPSPPGGMALRVADYDFGRASICTCCDSSANTEMLKERSERCPLMFSW
jgi:hypothetical protein